MVLASLFDQWGTGDTDNSYYKVEGREYSFPNVMRKTQMAGFETSPSHPNKPQLPRMMQAVGRLA